MNIGRIKAKLHIVRTVLLIMTYMTHEKMTVLYLVIFGYNVGSLFGSALNFF